MPTATRNAVSPPLVRAQLCRLLLLSLAASCLALDWPAECGSDDCSRMVACNISLADPLVARRVPVVRSSMPLAYSVVADARGRAFVGSLDGAIRPLILSPLFSL